MSSNKELIIDLIEDLPEDKVISLIYYAKFLKEQSDELDDYDYELSKEADNSLDSIEDAITLEDACEHLGVDFNKL